MAGIAALLVLAAAHDRTTPLALSWWSNGVLLAVIVGDVALSRRETVPGTTGSEAGTDS